MFGRGKEGREGFFVFGFFLEGGSVAGQVFVLVCVKKEAAPLVCMLFGGVGVRHGCLCRSFVVNMVVMRAWDVVAGAGRTCMGLGASVSRRGGDVRKRAPSCVYQRREGQVRAGGGACVAVCVQ